MLSSFGVQHSNDQDRQDRTRHAENEARPATSYSDFETTGVGSVTLSTPVQFDAAFLEKPKIAFGVEMLRAPDRDLYELPHVTAGTLRWVKDEKGAYTGVYVWVRVSCDPVLDEQGKVADLERIAQEPPTPELRHHLTVTGLSYKKLPTSVTSELTANL